MKLSPDAYRKLLASVLVATIAVNVIGGIVGQPRLKKAGAVSVVLLIATAVIVWLLTGYSPIPPWVTGTFSRIPHLWR